MSILERAKQRQQEQQQVRQTSVEGLAGKYVVDDAGFREAHPIRPAAQAVPRQPKRVYTPEEFRQMQMQEEQRRQLLRDQQIMDFNESIRPQGVR